MAKKDYYDVLGVAKTHQRQRLKKPLEPKPSNTTPIKIGTIPQPRVNSKK